MDLNADTCRLHEGEQLIRGDANADGIVNVRDFLTMSRNFGNGLTSCLLMATSTAAVALTFATSWHSAKTSEPACSENQVCELRSHPYRSR